MTEILKNWRNITIQATAEKEEVVERLDAMLRNMPLGICEQAKQARQLSIKCVWLFLVIVMHVILIYEVTRRSVQYYYNPVITTLTLHVPELMEFPQLYVCMAASSNRTFMLEHPNESKHFDRFRERVVKMNRKRRRVNELDENVVNAHDVEWYVNAHQESINRIRRQVTNVSHQAVDFDVYDFFYKAGYRVDETFLECSFREGAWKKFNCTALVEPVLDVNYGLCYNVKMDGKKQSVPGEGLRLIIQSHVGLYPTDDTNAPRSSGLYVSVSNKYDPSNWLKACAAPGQYTKIDLKATRVKMMNLEKGNLIQPCVDEKDSATLMNIFNATYSRTSCQLDCMFREFIRRCECILLVDKKVIRDDVVRTVEFCTPNQSQSCIVPQVTKNKEAMIEIDKCRSHCHSPCISWRYDMRTSTAPLNAAAFTRFALPRNNTVGDLLRIDVSFPMIEYAELIQSPSLTPFRLIADIGGLMNLWMGASVITILAVIVSLLHYLLTRSVIMMS